MSPPSISAEQLAALPPEFRALLQAVIDHYEARIAVLEARIVELERQVPRTPQNSSLPPSTQHPHAKPLPKKPRSKRNRGGQPGHPKHERTLIPVEQCCESFDHLPTQCRGLWRRRKRRRKSGEKGVRNRLLTYMAYFGRLTGHGTTAPSD